MIKAILVDDEKPALAEMEYLLNKENEIKIIGTYTDPISALENIKISKPDIVFMDIEMPIINGLNLAQEIIEMNKDIFIIFISAFSEYAIKAFEVNACDYLLKPVSKSRLSKCIEKIKKVHGKKENKKIKVEEKLDIEDNNIRSFEEYLNQSVKKLVAWDDEEIILIKIDDILYIETDSGNAVIVTKTKKYKSKSKMEELENKLSKVGFFRCHRCYIINLKHIHRISPMFNNYVISLESSNFKIPLSRTKVKQFKSILSI